MLVTANVFGPLIDVFETVLKFFHNSGGISWGLSIVLLTIAVRAVLIPLTFRQIKSMVRMQGLSPQMKEIQAKYKDDKQRQQQEIMKFYKENNVNPLGSCLPLVLQLPVFVSLYYMLKKNLRNDICPKTQALFREAYHTAHHVTLAAAHSETTACGHVPAAHFLFIHDLTAKATGIELGILIVLYVGSQLGSSLLMSAATMDPTQRKVMLFMPLIFVLRFPAGLLLYWITTNLWTVIQQYTVRRYIGPTVAVVPAGASGGSSKSGGGSLTGSGGTGNGSGSGGVGGLGARLRDRLSAAQAGGAEGRAETAKALRSNGAGSSAAGSSEKVAGTGSKGSGSSSRGRSGNGNGTRGGGPSSASAGASSKAASGRGRRGASSSNGSGSSNGDGSSTGGNGNGARAGAPPPRPPRKKKKRSGRRR
jgi:YidC/Oxa1 family membrane protein insertase